MGGEFLAHDGAQRRWRSNGTNLLELERVLPTKGTKGHEGGESFRPQIAQMEGGWERVCLPRRARKGRGLELGGRAWKNLDLKGLSSLPLHLVPI